MATLQIEQVPVSALIPYARNARKHSDEQVGQIAASIREFGFNNPVLIDGQGGIIAGHGRVLAAQKLKLDVVPCVRLDHLTEIQKRAYIIADNRLAETGGGWDTELLALEIEDLRLENFDIDLVGFSSEDLDAMFEGMDSDDDGDGGSEGLTDPDDAPEPPVDPISKPGDVWLLGVYYECEACGKRYTQEEGESMQECPCDG
jgi:ParB-like chromosome segregation protein Spo0J